MDATDPQEPHRLRPPPDERFAGSRHQYDLGAVAAGLRREAGTGGAGHRQQSLYKLGPMSVSLFLFAPQARLAPHQTRGTVVIQVLKGRLLVTAEGEPHELGPGGLLVLAAGVRHDVAAPEESEMLLTVTLDPPRPVPPA